MAGENPKQPAGPDLPGWDSDTDVAVEQEHKLAQPRMFRVLLHNDDYTTMEFVVAVLIQVFQMDQEKAVQVMLHVHERGVGIAGVYSFEIAETKVEQVTRLAREQEFPLLCTLEPES